MTSTNRIAATITLAFAALPAWADITVGISVSATGPAASLGIPEKNTAALLPTSVAGQKINYVILDDADLIQRHLGVSGGDDDHATGPAHTPSASAGEVSA